jgi:hypothetical protein
MQQEESKIARRRFVGLLGIFSIAGIAGAGGKALSKVKPTPKTVKMLTEDGKLVEVEVNALNGKRKRISDEELKTWIKK